jgi:hypothetical protein
LEVAAGMLVVELGATVTVTILLVPTLVFVGTGGKERDVLVVFDS